MIIIHCTNCTGKGTSALPEKFNGTILMRSSGVLVCPRCKCPEVMVENKNYSPSKGYINGGENEFSTKTTRREY